MSGASAVAILELLRESRVMRLTRVASASIVVYEYLITVDQEVSLIWRRKWSLAKVLFFINRYYILGTIFYGVWALFATDFLSDAFCLKYIRWQGWSGLVSFMLAQAILQLRIYALYLKNKKILILMLVCYIGTSSASAWVIWRAFNFMQIIVVELPIASADFCGTPQLYAGIDLFFVPLFLFDTLLCSLALHKGIQEFKTTGSLFHRGQSLLEILIRDSVLYFFLIAFTYLVCLFSVKFAPELLIEAFIGFGPVMTSTLTNRVLFSLREAGEPRSTPKAFNTRELRFEAVKPPTSQEWP